MADMLPENGSTRPPGSRTLTLGTRGSPLALAQAHWVADEIKARSGGAFLCDVQTFSTKGDQLTTERLINSGGKGLFTRELDAATLDGRLDLAVHSLKDVPTLLDPGMEIVAYPPREDAREAFICRSADHPNALPAGAVVGTASLRREAQTLAMRPDLSVIPFRGSVNTRLEKLDRGDAAATWLAMAGLTRLGMLSEVVHPIALEDMLPAAGQGILAIAVPSTLDAEAKSAVRALNDLASEAAATAERALLATLDGSCRTAIAAHLFESDGQYRLSAEVLSPKGDQCWRQTESLDLAPDTPVDAAALAALGESVGGAIRDAAGGDLPTFEDT
ncbi:MAG: hydroxymethylbilane synthase [Pseudomonadota bacterium]